MESIRYLALGDSYTIGTGLDDDAGNFPSLLATRLKDETGIDVALVNLGVNGYTTTDVIREELPVAQSARPDLVTILIGANDIVQGSAGAAPFGSPSNLRARVDAFNAIARTEANSAGFQYADITEISREASRGDDWLAADGLHPGATQHRAFADHLWEVADPTWTSIRR